MLGSGAAHTSLACPLVREAWGLRMRRSIDRRAPPAHRTHRRSCNPPQPNSGAGEGDSCKECMPQLLAVLIKAWRCLPSPGCEGAGPRRPRAASSEARRSPRLAAAVSARPRGPAAAVPASAARGEVVQSLAPEEGLKARGKRQPWIKVSEEPCDGMGRVRWFMRVVGDGKVSRKIDWAAAATWAEGGLDPWPANQPTRL